MRKTNDSVRYFVYARKSTESEDRQVQSIEDQLSRLRELAALRSLHVVETLTECKSAKTPDARPVFQDMIRRIKKGEGNGILCWQLNRLSRNPVDSGTLSWLLQQGILSSIVTIEREHRPDDNVLLFSVESGMANQFILDLSPNVKRGMQGKLERGEPVGRVPPGYLNDVAEKCVIIDPVRFPPMAEAWRLLLTGAYTVPAILKRLNEDLGYRSVKHRTTGGLPTSCSALYEAFQNPFYAGLIRVKGKEYQGRHTPMISVAEFERAQLLLGRRGAPRPKQRPFLFARLLQCAECGAAITAELKRKLVRTTGRVVEYVYYHCTGRKVGVHCSQRRCIREEALVEQFGRDLERLAIRPAFRDAALNLIRQKLQEEERDTAATIEAQELAVLQIEHQLERLTEMRYSDSLTQEEYERERVKLQSRLTRTEADQAQRLDNAGRLIRFEQATAYLVGMAERFRDASDDQKREMISVVGSNCLLRDGIPHIQARFWVERLHAWQESLEQQTHAFEPEVCGLSNAKTDPFGSAIPSWSALADDIQNFGPFPGGDVDTGVDVSRPVA